MTFKERKEYVDNNEIKWAKIIVQDSNTGIDRFYWFCDEKYKQEALEALEKEPDNEEYDFIVATKKHQEYYLQTLIAEREMFNVLYGKTYDKPVTNAYKHELLNYIKCFDSNMTVDITYFCTDGSNKTFPLGLKN